MSDSEQPEADPSTAHEPAPSRTTRRRIVTAGTPPSDAAPEGCTAAHDAPTGDPAATAAPLTAEPPAAEWVPLDSIVPYSRNPRRNDKTIPVVADSIRRFGWGAPIVARRETRTIIAGHARRGAALLLAKQWDKATSRERATWHADATRVATKGEVVARFVDLGEHDALLALIADNRIGEELSETDNESLAALMQELQAAHVDVLNGTGFSQESLDKLIAEAAGEGDGSTGGDPGDGRYQQQFGCIVICQDESEQQRVYEELRTEGYNVKVVTT